MRSRIILLISVFFVGSLMLMQSVLGAGPGIAWANQATLSTVDVLASQDPENSGYGMVQVSVWEEWNGGDWDIYMKYSLLDGALGSWVFPALHPATLPNIDEINPAVSVTRNHAVLGQEIHVAYQRWNAGIWEICHTYTNNLGVAWSAPVVISTAGVSSTNPACVYTEDQSNPGGIIGTLFQVVWEELFAPGRNQIMYRAYAYDPTWIPAPVRGYVPAIGGVPFLIAAPPPFPPTTSNELPEIASVDERASAAAYDYTFNIVWQQWNGLNWDIIYVDGTTTTSAVPPPPPPATIVLTPGSVGMLNVLAAGVDHIHPDIAASQDYAGVGGAQNYFFHVIWVKQTVFMIGTFTWDIEESYCFRPTPTPGAALFNVPGLVKTGPAPSPTPWFDNPTIATKLTSPIGAVPITIDTWFAWEDSTAAATTDIWYRAGTFTSVPPPAGIFFYFVAPTRVPYLPNPGVSTDLNPELWNREDSLRANPPLTHLVFDKNPHPAGVTTEVEYIDP